MPKTKISEYSATANSNTDVASINIDEGCAPSGINNAIRAVMGHLKDFQSGTNGDPFNGPVNGTVGATTPSTGAFTTLSASSTVTLSGGTANGVAYLNGSKVLTTGSALTFDGASLSVNSGTTNTVAIFTSTDAGAGIRLTDPTGSSSFETNGSLLRIGVDEDNVVASSEVAFRIDGSEKMRLTSTGLGIGTSSPTNLLHVSTTYAGANNYNLRLMNLGTTVSTAVGALWTTKDAGSNNISSAIISTTTDATSGAGGTALSFSTTSSGSLTERMRIDSSGNLIQTAPTTAPTLSTNGTMVFNLTSNTNLRVSVRGSDGVTRTANLTLA